MDYGVMLEIALGYLVGLPVSFAILFFGLKKRASEAVTASLIAFVLLVVGDNLIW